MTFHWLEGDELDILKPVIEERGWMALNQRLSRALGAFDGDGKLIGFIVMQCIPHVEPLWVDKEYRGTGLAGELAAEMVSFLNNCGIRGAYIVADNPASEVLAKHHGMEKITSPVYRSIR